MLQEYVLPVENSSTFEFPWNTTLVQSGAYYSLYANVRDINNNVTIIPPISVYVDNGAQYINLSKQDYYSPLLKIFKIF